MTEAASAGMTEAASAGMTEAASAGMTEAASAGMTEAASADMTERGRGYLAALRTKPRSRHPHASILLTYPPRSNRLCVPDRRAP